MNIIDEYTVACTHIIKVQNVVILPVYFRLFDDFLWKDFWLVGGSNSGLNLQSMRITVLQDIELRDVNQENLAIL